MSETSKKQYRSIYGRVAAFIRTRFSLEEDKACRDDVVASVSKSVEFRGVNLWVLIFATMIASLGLNVNSTAVIIGAMLISPIMGPIIGAGVALGINDFELLKKSLRNFALMMSTAMVASTLYFMLSPLSTNTSELIARTTPTAYDVLIALFGGLAGMVAQTRRDRSSTVIPGVAIATALIPPLCTAGFGIASGQWEFFFGALYLFFINTVFIAMASYAIVRLLKYEHKVFVDKKYESRVRLAMLSLMVVFFIPSLVIGFHMVRVSVFEANSERYVSQVFDFPQTRVVESTYSFAKKGEPSQIELLLVGEHLDDNVIENARARMQDYGLGDAQLTVRQANAADRVDLESLQQSYVELLEEKNARIERMRKQLERYRFSELDVEDVSHEAGIIEPHLGTMSLTKGISFDTEGTAIDTMLVCVVSSSGGEIDCERLSEWLRRRTKVGKIKIFVEENPISN